MIEFTDEFDIDRRESEDEDGHVVLIRVRRRGIELEIDALDFILALTGRGALKCKVRVRPEWLLK